LGIRERNTQLIKKNGETLRRTGRITYNRLLNLKGEGSWGDIHADLRSRELAPPRIGHRKDEDSLDFTADLGSSFLFSYLKWSQKEKGPRHRQFLGGCG